MTNLIKSWNSRQIRIRSDRYVSLTDMAQAAGKNVNDFLRLDKTKSYLETLSAITGIPVMTQNKGIQPLLEVRKGGDVSASGTWGHPKVAIRFAQWCSDEFAVQVDTWIDELLTTGSVRVKQGKQNQSPEWLQTRSLGKSKRRSLTDAIKGYIDRHPELSDGKRKYLYLNASESLNVGIFDKRSNQLKSLLGLSKHNALRDGLSSEENSTLLAIEFLASQLIEYEDLEPCTAVKKAIDASYSHQMFAEKYLSCDSLPSG